VWLQSTMPVISQGPKSRFGAFIIKMPSGFIAFFYRSKMHREVGWCNVFYYVILENNVKLFL
jgi:hypothetical protein